MKKMMKPREHVFGKLAALVGAPADVLSAPTKALVLLHGVGSNEQDLYEIGSQLSQDHLIVSMRAPIVMAANAFAWFHVQFTQSGPVHDWEEAKASFLLLENAISDLSNKMQIPMDKISVFGFSQGAIMTLGLALTSKLNLENYVAVSGRTLPEFSKAASENPLQDYSLRRVFVMHGEYDGKLPIKRGRDTEQILKSTSLKYKYQEFPAEHTITPQMLTAAKEWLAY